MTGLYMTLAHGVEIPFLGGISRDNLPSEMSLYTVLYMFFPTYTAYVLGILGKILLGMFSFRLLAGELFADKYVIYRPVTEFRLLPCIRLQALYMPA